MTSRTILLLGAIAAAATSFGGASRPGAAPAPWGDELAPLAFQVSAALDDWRALSSMPPAPWNAADPADSLYRVAREAMNRGNFGEAAELFRRVSERYPDSDYAPAALYYEAFALYRIGGESNLRLARRALDRQRERFPDEARDSDAPALRARIDGELARRGDATAAEAVMRGAVSVGGGSRSGSAPAGSTGASGGTSATVSGRGGARASASSTRAGSVDSDDCPRGEEDERIVALNALLQMDAERALPLLERILERRDECSVQLRRRAMFLVSQKSGADRERILLDAARNDPDAEVREQAVFWLSQVDTEGATTILADLLRASRDEGVQEKALFALSQKSDPRAGRVLREYAERADAPKALRDRAIFWISQHRDPENTAFLRALYGRLDDDQLKERVLFALSQRNDADGQRWLLEIAQNPRESDELRGRALFWAGQGTGLSSRELGEFYRRVESAKLKESAIFALSQRNEREAVDQLMAIARQEPSRPLRERAIFWLSQSKDPRVADFLMEIIDRRP